MSRLVAALSSPSRASGLGATSPLPLELEKLGVIAGFLAGLFLGLGHIHGLLLAHGVPALAASVVTVLSIAVTTWLGLRVTAAVARLMRTTS